MVLFLIKLALGEREFESVQVEHTPPRPPKRVPMRVSELMEVLQIGWYHKEFPSTTHLGV
jgi:hypothetical protein